MNIVEKQNSSFHLYYFFLIISLYFSLGFILSFFYPLANDAGKYFSVMKEVANGSVIHNDIIPGTVNYSFYTLTSFFLKLYNWDYETFRCLLVFLNGLGIISLYISLNKVFTNFVSSLWISFYALNPFIISRVLEINHYSISNIFLLFGMSFILTSTRFKSNLLFFLSIFSFTVCGLLRPHLAFLPVATILFYVVICKNKLQTLFLSSLILIFLIFMNSSFYSNSETTNQSRQNEILYLSEIIDKIPIDKKKNIILNIAKDAQIDLVNINTLSFVGDDPSYESDKYISMNECDSKIENPYIKQNENNIHKNEIISKHWCYYDHKGNYHQSLIENNNFTDSGLEKLIKRLKIGCGNGWFLDMVKNDVASVECIELSPPQVLKLREKGYKCYDLMIEDLKIKKKYDVICLFAVLEHVANVENFLTVLKKFLKPDGNIFIEVPNRKNILFSGFKVESFRKFYYRDIHLYYFTPKSLKKLLSKNGYKCNLETSQQASITNHFHWLHNKKGQENANIMTSIYIPDIDLEKQFSDVLEQTDNFYRKTLNENGLGDLLFARASL